jgi:hypothetical protein
MRTIKKLLSFFWSLQTFRVRGNSKFKDLHKGQTCLIFGNGASLKYYDFDAIPDDLIAITCSFSLVDKRLKKKNVKYNIFSEPYIFYPYVYNDYVDKVQKNPIRRIFRKLIAENKHINFLPSITNSLAYFSKPSNVHYWHHFGLKDFSSNDLAGKFSTCSTALDNMIGLARYLGFSKALLLGCDYMCNPKMEGHFYANKVPVFGKEDLESQKRIRKSVGDLDVLVICSKDVSSREFPSVTFEEYFKALEVYQTNKEIIDEDDLKLMQDIADAKVIFI